MKSTVVSLSLLFSLNCLSAEGVTAPKVEAVPVPTKPAKVEVETNPDVDLIKTEKNLVDKSCKMVGGKLKCPPKNRKVKRKTL